MDRSAKRAGWTALAGWAGRSGCFLLFSCSFLSLALRRKNCDSRNAGSSGAFLAMAPQIMLSENGLEPDRGEENAALEEDLRLRNDIRLLGRILGDTVRDQEGADVFDLVERIRQTSIRFHRGDDAGARSELELILDSMSISQTLRIVRAFSYFSHLANIAEDQNNIRRMRQSSKAGELPRPETLARTLLHARTAGISAMNLRKFFASALVSPVLTAHPTEVRRKSTIDREMEIAAVLDQRERAQLTPEELAGSDEQFIEILDADLHDFRDSTATREIYVYDSVRFGIRRNRSRVLIRQDDVVAISRFADVATS